jgi:hypothetical protein
MTSPRGKLTAPACSPTKKLNKADESTYIFVDIGVGSPNVAKVSTSSIVTPEVFTKKLFQCKYCLK